MPAKSGSSRRRQLGDVRLVGTAKKGGGFRWYHAVDLSTGHPAVVQSLGNKEEHMIREVRLLRKLQHDNILFPRKVVKGKRHHYVIYSDDFANSRELGEILVREAPTGMPEARARSLFQQLLLALLHCHSRGIAHKSVCVADILISLRDGRLLLVGLRDEGRGVSDISCITPEGISQTGSTNLFARDMWGAGTVLFTLLAGEPPFDSTSFLGLLDKIEEGKRTRLPHSVSTSAKMLVDGLLDVNPSRRFTITEAIEDKWASEGLSQTRVKYSLRRNAAGYDAWLTACTLLLFRKKGHPILKDVPVDLIACTLQYLSFYAPGPHVYHTRSKDKEKKKRKEKKEKQAEKAEKADAGGAPPGPPATWERTPWGWRAVDSEEDDDDDFG